MEKFSKFRVTIIDKPDGNLRGMVSCLVADCMYLTGIRVVSGSKGLFVSMASRKNQKGEYDDIYFPASKEVRAELQSAVLKAYDEALAGPRP